jgi:23S rRNA (uracil1939-C5)-methyltransferase
MARRRKRRAKLPEGTFTAEIESLSHDGRGVARDAEGKTVFIHGALPNERVDYVYTEVQKKFDLARAVEIHEANPDRVEPKCEAFERCGGCALQHLDADKQILFKEQTLKDNFARIGKVEPQSYLPPLTGPHWTYRRKARLGVKFVRAKDKVVVGFRERSSNFLTDMSRCEVLDSRVGDKLEAIGAVIYTMEARERIPQIEVACTDESVSLVFRHLDSLSGSDKDKLVQLAKDNDFMVGLQSKGPASVINLYPMEQELFYTLPAYDVRIDFKAHDFAQVNHDINNKMQDLAIELLDIQPEETVLDLFAGLGNFTLPMARKAGKVVGVELDEMMVMRAGQAAKQNGITNTEHYTGNLFEPVDGEDWTTLNYDKVLLDPPRSGAIEILPTVAKMQPKRIVYVSCHPGSLARDAGVLVNELGYTMTKAGVMDMFPHTAHVESIAVFER